MNQWMIYILFACPSAYLSIRLYAGFVGVYNLHGGSDPPVCPSVYPSVCLSVCRLRRRLHGGSHPSVRPSVCPSIRPFVCLQASSASTWRVTSCTRPAAGEPSSARRPSSASSAGSVSSSSAPGSRSCRGSRSWSVVRGPSQQVCSQRCTNTVWPNDVHILYRYIHLFQSSRLIQVHPTCTPFDQLK